MEKENTENKIALFQYEDVPVEVRLAPESDGVISDHGRESGNAFVFRHENHSFSDGNKRIAAAVFLYFLERNGMLMCDGAKRISDHTLVAVIVMIAESKPEEKRRDDRAGDELSHGIVLTDQSGA